MNGCDKNKRQDEVFAKIAREMSSLSKCVSFKVCALLVKDGRIISTGINGSLPGATNCCDAFSADDFDREEHHRWSSVNELHAEINALLRCREDTEGATMYLTLEPCRACALAIVMARVKRVVYIDGYDRTSDETRKLLEDSGVTVERVAIS